VEVFGIAVSRERLLLRLKQNGCLKEVKIRNCTGFAARWILELQEF
jgi:hypothetical protein